MNVKRWFCCIREVDDGKGSGIEGILTRLEKERNSSLGISLSGKGESNVAMNDDTSPNGSVPRSSMVVVCSFCLQNLLFTVHNLLSCLPTFFFKRQLVNFKKPSRSQEQEA